MTINKKGLTEADIRTKFITPAIQRAGWNTDHQMREKVRITHGRIVVRGKVSTRKDPKRADYVLYHKPTVPLTVVEAKYNNHTLGDGIQQALAGAQMHDAPPDSVLDRDLHLI